MKRPWSVRTGDCRTSLRRLAPESVQCCITGPPCWGLRDYATEGQLGLERTPEEYVDSLVACLREVRRVLRADGTLWLSLGDTYYGGGGGNYGDSKSTRTHAEHLTNVRNRGDVEGLKPKDLVGIPWRVALALQADGWYLRADVIWSKPNAMPASATDRPTRSHEYLFLLSKAQSYLFDQDAVKVELPNGFWRNCRTVWEIPTQPFRGPHFAVMPEALVAPCVKASTAPGDTVLDPFVGVGTVGIVALDFGRRFVGVDLKPEYAAISRERLSEVDYGNQLYEGKPLKARAQVCPKDNYRKVVG